MQTTPLYKEAKRLYDLSWAIHWLHPNSKRPLESGWTTGPRKNWVDLKTSYDSKLNVGVRLGNVSKIADRGYLAVIDVDVKSTEERHRKEAHAAAKALVGNSKCPIVKSGRGNGSRHYYCITAEPFKTWNPYVSKEEIKVYYPSKKPSKKELDELTATEIAAGMRLSPAWEVSLYSNGRQVVLPPSIHPDSNRPYEWVVGMTDLDSLPLIEFKMPEESSEKGESNGILSGKDYTGKDSNDVADFVVEEVTLEWLQISERALRGITTGEGVTDRSAYLLPACNALLSAGLTKNEILSVLTDKSLFIGGCAYEHAQTTNRKRAALWVWKYTLKKVMDERDASNSFDSAVELGTLDEMEAAKQAEELESDIDWRNYLDTTEKGKYRNTYHNCYWILTHSCEREGFIGRNEFANNNYFLIGTPWGSTKGESLIDIDLIRIKQYCVDNFSIEFNSNLINDVLLSVADINRFHPVRDYLNSLVWDGVPRIDTWLADFAGAVGPSPYLPDVSRKLLCAMVARVMSPGCKFDQIVILEGTQGTGKSTLIRRLAGDEWFSDAPMNIGDKDAVLTMQSKWVIEVGELSSMNKAEVDVFKVFAAQRTDRIRAPYGKHVEEYPRQSVLIGTTNNDEYLRDLTGNRRFWSVKTEGKIDFEGITVARDQLFAEAKAYYELGEPLWLDDAVSEAQSHLEQAERMETDEWAPLVEAIVNEVGFPKERFSMLELATRMEAVGAHKLSLGDKHRIGRCLRELGFEKFKDGSTRRKLWRTSKKFIGTLPDSSGTLEGFEENTIDYY